MQPPALALLATLLLPLSLATSGSALDPTGDQGTTLAYPDVLLAPGAPRACADPATDLTGVAVDSAEGRVTVRVTVADAASPGVACGTLALRAVSRTLHASLDGEAIDVWAWTRDGKHGVVVCTRGPLPCASPTHGFAAEGDVTTWTFPLAAPADEACACPAYDLAGHPLRGKAQSASHAERDPWEGWPAITVADETGPLHVTL